MLSQDEKECPYCAEVIKAKAIVCRYCNRELSATQPLSESRHINPVESVSPTPSKKTSSSKFRNSLGMDFVLIQPGSFMMGSPESEAGRGKDETQHRVTLTKGFYLQTTPVTYGQWKALRENFFGDFQEKDRPVQYVSWNGCQIFIEKLNQSGEGQYRLPTEAEWEYACRAGSQSAYCYGDDIATLGEYAWYKSNSGDRTHPVGQKKPNALGLYDMHGNVYEWCQDWYGDYPTESVIDPQGSKNSGYRVIRGGSRGDVAHHCRSACRRRCLPGIDSIGLGFRLLRSL